MNRSSALLCLSYFLSVSASNWVVQEEQERRNLAPRTGNIDNNGYPIIIFSNINPLEGADASSWYNGPRGNASGSSRGYTPSLGERQRLDRLRSIGPENMLIYGNIPRVQLGDFVKKTTDYLRLEYLNRRDNYVLEEALTTIYRYFEGDMNKICLFMGHAIFGTSGLTCMESSGSDIWKSRGLMQVTTENSYRLFGELLRGSLIDIQPEEVSKLDSRIVLGHLKIWNRMIKNYLESRRNSRESRSNELTFIDTVIALNPANEVSHIMDGGANQSTLSRYDAYQRFVSVFCRFM